MLQLVHHEPPDQQDTSAEAVTGSDRQVIEVDMEQAPVTEASRQDCGLAERRAPDPCVKSSQPGSAPLGKDAAPAHLYGRTMA